MKPIVVSKPVKPDRINHAKNIMNAIVWGSAKKPKLMVEQEKLRERKVEEIENQEQKYGEEKIKEEE